MIFIIDFFFFNDTATTEIYTLSLHDALPISRTADRLVCVAEAREASPKCSRTVRTKVMGVSSHRRARDGGRRSEEHTSELQSRQYLVCRLLLEKKKKKKYTILRFKLIQIIIS